MKNIKKLKADGGIQAPKTFWGSPALAHAHQKVSAIQKIRMSLLGSLSKKIKCKKPTEGSEPPTC
jgi:hypothetical protein